MAISASMVWEVRSTATAANANGGGFKPNASGVDYSQQNAAQYNLVSCTSAAANAIILNANAAADMVGNVAHVISGTNATPGWYEITAVSVGVSITVDRNWGTGAVSSGVVNIGGAISLGSSTVSQSDTDFAAALVAGNTVHVKSANTIAATFTTTAGASGTPITFNGYSSARGDNPTGASRPTINCSTFTLTTGSVNAWKNIIFTGSAANMVTHSGGGGSVSNCKFTNTSTTAARNAINVATANAIIQDSEVTSYRGNGINASNTIYAYGNYIHDCDIGINLNTSGSFILSNNIIESCVTSAVSTANSGAVISTIQGNTLYGSEAKTGTGLVISSGLTGLRILNNVIYGFATGINDANAAGISYEDYNLFNNNTTNRTNISAGSHSITSAPAFSSVQQVTGTAGTVSSATITDAAANFANVTDNRDFCYVISGTGATAGQYLITSHTATSVTLTVAPGGSGTNINYQVTTGRNFAVGAGAKQVGFPAAFQAGLTTSYVDLGAAQRNGDLDQPGIGDVRSGLSFNLGTLTGTLVGGSKHLGPSHLG